MSRTDADDENDSEPDRVEAKVSYYGESKWGDDKNDCLRVNKQPHD